jgi:hypothetical protein
MKTYIVLLLLVFSGVIVIAQPPKVEKACAFFTVSLPGMAIKDDNGNIIPPPQIIERFIYVECRFTGKPKIDSVFYNNNFFIPVLDTTPLKVVQAGIKKIIGKPVNLVAKKGNYLWRVDLQQTGEKLLTPGMIKKITIKGRLNKTKFVYSLNTETELTAPDRY